MNPLPGLSSTAIAIDLNIGQPSIPKASKRSWTRFGDCSDGEDKLIGSVQVA